MKIKSKVKRINLLVGTCKYDKLFTVKLIKACRRQEIKVRILVLISPIGMTL